jgi:hypothetical protein
MAAPRALDGDASFSMAGTSAFLATNRGQRRGQLLDRRHTGPIREGHPGKLRLRGRIRADHLLRRSCDGHPCGGRRQGYISSFCCVD